MTNAVQILSNTEGRDNHVIQQVAILLKELCRLHAVPEPPDIENLTLPVMPHSVSRYIFFNNYHRGTFRILFLDLNIFFL